MVVSWAHYQWHGELLTVWTDGPHSLGSHVRTGQSRGMTWHSCILNACSAHFDDPSADRVSPSVDIGTDRPDRLAAGRCR